MAMGAAVVGDDGVYVQSWKPWLRSYGGMLVPVLRLLFVCRGGGQGVFGCMTLFFTGLFFFSIPGLYVVVPPLFLLQLALVGGRAYTTALQAVKKERERCEQRS
jgi:hypothetical protein